MDEGLKQRLRSQIQQGQAILFTGAGFSVGTRSQAGQPVPLPAELAQDLWDVAFPGESFDDSSLGDVYEAALRQARKRTEAVLADRLTIDPDSLAEEYQLWFSFPWHSIYTINVDSLASAANRAFDLPRQLRSYSALSDPTPDPYSGELPVVHLNGMLKDLPNITFSMRQYGERLAGPDPWYELLIRDLQLRPVVYVGTSIDEPPLWTYIEARGDRPDERERRPGSYLVSPFLKRARGVALGSYNISWVGASREEFASDVLEPLVDAAQQGQRAVAERLAADHGGRIVLPLLDIVDDSQGDEREYLQGREPRWSDITQGYAFEREFDTELASTAFSEKPSLLVVTGTAGSGKSSSGMRLAIESAARGARTAVLNEFSTGTLREIRTAVRVSGAQFLFLDNAERFGEAATDLLGDLLADNPELQILACIRSNRLERLGQLSPPNVDSRELVVPKLGPSDVESLLDALTRAKRLGALKGMTHAQMVHAVESRFDQQLLVAMIEITSDERFDEKVESECQEMEGDSATAYAAAALATSMNSGLEDHELVTASGSASPADGLEAIDRLLRRHLLVRKDGRILVRHKVIAQRAVEYFRGLGALQPVVTDLAYALAASARLGDLRKTPSGRLLVRLINHETLIRLLYRRTNLDADRAAVRAVYDRLERVLDGDFHFWLQRGSFETEEGDLDAAKNFLEQAKGMRPNDSLVRTEWSYMSLKRAAARPDDPQSLETAEAAFGELEEVIEVRGRRDFQPFHIYGSQGLRWSRRGPLGRDERKRTLERLRSVLGEGIRLHPDRDELKVLKSDLDREYMMLAVPPDS